MIEYIAGLVLAFGTLVLVPLLGFTMSLIVLRVLSDRGQLDWYRSNRMQLDIVLNLVAFLLPAVLGATVLWAVVTYLIGPYLLLESGPMMLLLGGLAALLFVILTITTIFGHRTRSHALESHVLE